MLKPNAYFEKLSRNEITITSLKIQVTWSIYVTNRLTSMRTALKGKS